MSTESELMEDELAQLRRQFEVCASEVQPKGDFDTVLASVFEEGSVASGSDNFVVVHDPEVSPRRSNREPGRAWLAVAAALIFLAGSGLYFATRDVPDRRTPVDQEESQPKPVVIPVPEVHRLLSSEPGAWFFNFSQEFIQSRVQGSTAFAEAVVGQSRIVSLVDENDAVWWVSAVEAPETHSIRLTITRDGHPTSFWSSAPTSGTTGPDVPADLSEWATNSMKASTLSGPLAAPPGWRAGPEQLATEFLVDASGQPTTVTAEGRRQTGGTLTISSMPLPEGFSPSEMPRWVLIAAGVGSPERVVSEAGSIGWFEPSEGILHFGIGNDEHGTDVQFGLISASDVDRADVAAAMAELEAARKRIVMVVE